MTTFIRTHDRKTKLPDIFRQIRSNTDDITFTTCINTFFLYLDNASVCGSHLQSVQRGSMYQLLSLAVHTEMCQQIRGTCSLNNTVSWEHWQKSQKINKTSTSGILFKWMTATRKLHNNLSKFAAPVVCLHTHHLCRNHWCYILQRAVVLRSTVEGSLGRDSLSPDFPGWESRSGVFRASWLVKINSWHFPPTFTAKCHSIPGRLRRQ